MASPREINDNEGSEKTEEDRLLSVRSEIQTESLDAEKEKEKEQTQVKVKKPTNQQLTVTINS